MRCTHFAIYLVLLAPSCLALRMDNAVYPDPGILRRASSTGSTSTAPTSSAAKSPPRHSVRLFGVTVTPGVKGPAPAAHHPQAQHTPPVHTTQSHHTPAVHHASQENSSHPGRKGHARSSAMYTQWTKGLSGHLAKDRPGPRPHSLNPPVARVSKKRKPQVPKLQGPIPQGAKALRRPAGTHPRYHDQRRYRERKKAKQEQHNGKHPAGHHEHPPRGGNGGRGPGSPDAGAGAHAVTKRKVQADHRSSVRSG